MKILQEANVFNFRLSWQALAGLLWLAGSGWLALAGWLWLALAGWVWLAGSGWLACRGGRRGHQVCQGQHWVVW